MFYSMKSPLALYRAFKAANVPDDIARDAAYAVRRFGSHDRSACNRT